jgi:uncharacterized protein YukE
MQPLVAFPEDRARKVLEYAARLGEHAVKEVIDKIRDVFGHPEKIVPLADSWGLDAKVKVMNSTGSITNARSNLAAYWEGPAFDSFKIYIDHLEKVFEKAVEIFAGEADLLQNMAKTMTDVYNAGIKFLTDCAAIIVEATGGIIGAIKDWFGVADVIAKAIADFLRSTSELMVKLETAITEYRTNGQDLRQKAAELKLPEAIPSSSVDVAGWDVRSRKGG